MKPDFSIAALVKPALSILVLAPLMVAIAGVLGGSASPMTKPLYDVTGHVRVFQADLMEGLKDRSGVVAWLDSTQTAQQTRLAARGRIAPYGVAKFIPEMAAISTRTEFE